MMKDVILDCSASVHVSDKTNDLILYDQALIKSNEPSRSAPPSLAFVASGCTLRFGLRRQLALNIPKGRRTSWV